MWGVMTLVAWMAVACGEPERVGESAEAEAGIAGEEAPLDVYVVNYPLQYFAKRIGGEDVRVSLPVPGNVDPAFWSPDVEVVAAYQGADLVLLNGAGYEKWVDVVSLSASKLVDTSRSFADRHVTIEDGVTHTHGPGGEHSHGEIAFTTWLDPDLAIKQARAIKEAFSAARPASSDTFETAYETLERDLVLLDQQLRMLTAGQGEVPLIASHPVYQYLASAYDLNVRSVHLEPDEIPLESEWRRLQEILLEHPAHWMIWEGEPLLETTARLREMGIQSVVYDPCANVPEEGDFLAVMRENLLNLERVFDVRTEL
jgi:zinc transport system substrate-binding protein